MCKLELEAISNREILMSFLPLACCSQLPPVQAEYSPKGSYTTIDGLKAYVIGPEDAMVSVLVVYDIFGYSPQILQGESLFFLIHYTKNSSLKRD